MTPAEHLAAARRGLTAAVERYARMVEPRPAIDVPIPGSAWTARDATFTGARSHGRAANRLLRGHLYGLSGTSQNP